ncbi:hypothetical protein [Saccharothrix sp. ST-888]|uniref:hypothetical protein n=1 Tax=Saccharothrix sp. ST-888 TaxID=1427391 RepID=UPI0005ECDEEC|nr:hypothetical protein [Saccharothrix sp. ST-888]KJK57690.1 hypothetical protein UK12_15035 [Saccharothrix sp. ST-888]
MRHLADTLTTAGIIAAVVAAGFVVLLIAGLARTSARAERIAARHWEERAREAAAEDPDQPAGDDR